MPWRATGKSFEYCNNANLIRKEMLSLFKFFFCYSDNIKTTFLKKSCGKRPKRKKNPSILKHLERMESIFFTLQRTHRYERQPPWLKAAQLSQSTIDILTPNALFIIQMKCNFISPHTWNCVSWEFKHVNEARHSKEYLSPLCPKATWGQQLVPSEHVGGGEEDGELLTFYLITFRFRLVLWPIL